MQGALTEPTGLTSPCAMSDAGWEHYADRWQVLDAGGTVLGERVLLHPHDTEQPFTRSQSGIEIPAGIRAW
jgi:hypothetical protein